MPEPASHLSQGSEPESRGSSLHRGTAWGPVTLFLLHSGAAAWGFHDLQQATGPAADRQSYRGGGSPPAHRLISFLQVRHRQGSLRSDRERRHATPGAGMLPDKSGLCCRLGFSLPSARWQRRGAALSPAPRLPAC